MALNAARLSDTGAIAPPRASSITTAVPFRKKISPKALTRIGRSPSSSSQSQAARARAMFSAPGAMVRSAWSSARASSSRSSSATARMAASSSSSGRRSKYWRNMGRLPEGVAPM